MRSAVLMLSLFPLFPLLTGCPATDDPSEDSGVSSTDTASDTDTLADTDLVISGLGGEQIVDGADYFDITADGIPLFSFSRHSLKITNNSDSAITVNSATLGIDPEGEHLIWQMIDPDETAWTSLSLDGAVVEPGAVLYFDVLFQPVEMGMATADLIIDYGGSSYTATVSGRGRDNGVFSPWVNTTQHKVIGGSKTTQDSVVGGSVTTASGDLIISSNVNGWGDTFSKDIGLSSTSMTGDLKWHKVWHEDYEQLQPDPGQNGESGGSADSISIGATNTFLTGRRSQSSANSLFQTLVLAVNGDTGAPAWARGWSPGDKAKPAIASESSTGYAVNADAAGRVLVAGTVHGDAEVLLMALDASDGSVIWDYSIDLVSGSNDRAHSVAYDFAGNAYLGGITDGRGFLMKVSGVDGDGTSLAVEWAKKIDMGVGSNIDSLACDASGNVYVSMDRRGAATFFSAGRFNPDGTFAWGKTWDETNSNDQNNTYVVRTEGDSVYVGGRVGFQPFDTQFGEGFLLELAQADGAYQHGSMFYNGKGAEEMTEHRVKGIGFKGDKMLLGVQSYTSSLNFEHYWGYWYSATDAFDANPPGTGATRLVDYAPTITDLTATLTDVQGTAHTLDTASWQAPPSDVMHEDSWTAEGNGGDGDVNYMQLEVQ